MRKASGSPLRVSACVACTALGTGGFHSRFGSAAMNTAPLNSRTCAAVSAESQTFISSSAPLNRSPAAPPIHESGSGTAAGSVSTGVPSI